MRIIRTVKDDLGAWNLHRLVWVADAGFASAANRAYLTRGGGHYLHAEKLRHITVEAAAALARAGRYHDVADNLRVRVKDVRVAPGGGDQDGVRAERFVVCHNPDAAERDAAVRERLIEHLGGLIDGSDTWPKTKRDELVGSLRNKPGLRRLLGRTKAGLMRTSDPNADRRGPGRRLQTTHRRGTRLARLQKLARAAPGLPPPRRPHPRPHPIMLAGTASHPRRRNPHRRHLAQPAPRTGPHAPGHPRHRRRLLPGTENDDDAVTLDEDEDGGVGRHLDGVIAAVTASSARWRSVGGVVTPCGKQGCPPGGLDFQPLRGGASSRPRVYMPISVHGGSSNPQQRRSQ